MVNSDWKYYNHGWLPDCAPHEIPNLEKIEDREFFSKGGILARYTTDFDCKEQTDWWYIIKDNVFDISKLKSKHRYVVKQGNKNFEIRIIDPQAFKEDIFAVAVEAFNDYPKKYRPVLTGDSFYKNLDDWIKYGKVVYGAFYRENNKLAGYAVTFEESKCINLEILKTMPSFEKMQVNAALVNGILENCANKLESGFYICNGARNILHETHFPDYLIKYFQFRKAYCKLHIVYNPKYKNLILFLYKFRKLFYKLDRGGGRAGRKIHQLNGVLKMEEIVQCQTKENK